MTKAGTQSVESLRCDLERLAKKLLATAAPLASAEGAGRDVLSAIERSLEAIADLQPRESPLCSEGGEPVEVLGIGEEHPPAWIVGPCMIESYEQISIVAEAAKAAGGRILRGGAFKTRTSPHSFQGPGEEGLVMLRRAADAQGMAVITEASGLGNLDIVAETCDAIQIGSRNAQSPELLDAAGRVAASLGKGVVVKRGFGCTVAEWISAAEYVAAHTDKIILCERGIRTFEPGTRFTLDVAAVPLARAVTRLPIIVDASHAAGKREMVAPLAAAGLAAGADGVMLEVHPSPEQAMSDNGQQIRADELNELIESVRRKLVRAASWNRPY